MSPNSKTILGSGSGGSDVEYEIVAKYGKPLTLDAIPFSNDSFIGWYKNGARIPNEYYDFDDGEIIEARFGKVITINIVHIGSGYGETSVAQEKEIIEESNGRSSYSLDVIDEIPIKLEYTLDEKLIEFNGWRDSEGNALNPNSLELYDGMTIYAEFNMKTTNIIVSHKGGDISSSVSQYGIVLNSGEGINTTYTAKPRVDGDLQIIHHSNDSSYEFESIKDELGVTYNDGIVPSNMIRAGMKITISYKLSHIGVTIKHVGTSGGYTKASQDGIKLGDGNGGQGVQYNVLIDKNKPLSLYGEPQEQQGDMISIFLGFEYENGTPVGANDTFSDGQIVYAVFDIEIDHDFEWLFKVYWDERSKTDIDTYAKLMGGDLDGQFVYYGRKIQIVDDENSVELDIDNTRGGNGNPNPEVITILGKPCDSAIIRLHTFGHGESLSGMDDLRVEVYRKGERFNEHTKDYFIPSSIMTDDNATYEVCQVDLSSGVLTDIEQYLGTRKEFS